jgi:hypothetical protein
VFVIFRRPWLAYGVIVLLPAIAVTLVQSANRATSAAARRDGVRCRVLHLDPRCLARWAAMLVAINFSY